MVSGASFVSFALLLGTSFPNPISPLCGTSSPHEKSAKQPEALSDQKCHRASWELSDWIFSAYQNAECHGVRNFYYGFGSTKCRTDLLNGSIMGYIKEFLTPDCTLAWYKDRKCQDEMVVVTESTPKRCGTANHAQNMKSFKVSCNDR